MLHSSDKTEHYSVPPNHIMLTSKYIRQYHFEKIGTERIYVLAYNAVRVKTVVTFSNYTVTY